MEEMPVTFAALEIQSGAVVHQDDLLTGTVSESMAKDVALNSHPSDMGGIYVAGEGSDYTVLHANIRTSGDGEGLGGKISGASVKNYAKLTLKN